MEHIILHRGGMTVTLESNDTVTVKDRGKCPTLDDIARQRALNVYMVSHEDTEDDTWGEVG